MSTRDCQECGGNDGEFVKDSVRWVSERLAAGMGREDILGRLVQAGEEVAGPGCVVSILVLDEEGLLRNGASPNLPADYLRAIDRLRPNAAVGTCASAAATGMPVITPSFLEDNKWAELRHLPHALGFAGAWSMPIKGKSGKVLGTFGTYFPLTRVPSEVEKESVSLLAKAAALVLECSAEKVPGRASCEN